MLEMRKRGGIFLNKQVVAWTSSLIGFVEVYTHEIEVLHKYVLSCFFIWLTNETKFVLFG